jgi:hypothetical protein
MSMLTDVTAAVESGFTTADEIAAHLGKDRKKVKQGLLNAWRLKRIARVSAGRSFGAKRGGKRGEVEPSETPVFAPRPRDCIAPLSGPLNVIPLNRTMPVTSIWDMGQRAAPARFANGEEDWLRPSI